MSKLEELLKEYCPDGVEELPFNDVAEYLRGITYNKSDEINVAGEEGIPVFRANNITLEYNKLNFEDVKQVKTTVKVSYRQWLKENDILICAGSGSKEHIGKVAFIENDMKFTFGGFMGVIRVNNSIIMPRYMFHILTSPIFKLHLEKASGSSSSTINNINNDTWRNWRIPVPPIEVQREIVRILDNFTELTVELTAELTARKKQYEYYRDQLLNFEKIVGVESKFLSDIADISTGSSNTEDAEDTGIYPFYVRSQEPLRKNTFEYDEEAIITAGDGVGVGKVFHYVNGKYALHQRAYRIHPIAETVDGKYLFYYFSTKFPAYIAKTMYEGSVPSIRRPMLNKFEVDVPDIETQKRIVNVLDNFDTICSNLNTGLPAEIAARQKQYEYYRDKLLSFKEN